MRLYRDVGFLAQAPTLAILAAQKLISRFGYYEKLNDFAKRFFPPVIDEGYFVRSHTFLVRSLARHRIPRPRLVYEQGTGWHGAELLVFYLLGAERIVTSDTSAWLRIETLEATIKVLLRHQDALVQVYKELLGDSASVLNDRFVKLSKPGAAAKLISDGTLEYVVTKDLSWTPEDFARFDLVYSNSVLQRMPLDDLKTFLAAKRNSAATHYHRIDCADFQAMRNPAIHKLAYLLIDESSWRNRTSTYLNYQNRLRGYEFIDLFTSNGYLARLVDEYAAEDSVAFILKHRGALPAKYRSRHPREVAITNFTLLAKAAG
jgi:hypothetical protein